MTMNTEENLLLVTWWLLVISSRKLGATSMYLCWLSAYCSFLFLMAAESCSLNHSRCKELITYTGILRFIGTYCEQETAAARPLFRTSERIRQVPRYGLVSRCLAEEGFCIELRQLWYDYRNCFG